MEQQTPIPPKSRMKAREGQKRAIFPSLIGGGGGGGGLGFPFILSKIVPQTVDCSVACKAGCHEFDPQGRAEFLPLHAKDYAFV